MSAVPTPEVDIDLVDRWLSRACESLLSTWDERTGNFWRDSWEAQADTSEDETDDSPALGRGKGATSNNRSFQALIAAVYYFHENASRGSGDLGQRLTAAARRMVLEYFTLPLKDLRGHGENHENPFTDAQLLLSLSLALSPVTSAICNLDPNTGWRATLVGHLRDLAREVARHLGKDGVKVHESARSHHFLTLHAIRGLDAATRTLEVESPGRVPKSVRVEGRDSYGELLGHVRDEIVQQLGLHLLPAPGFDSSSLVSCCALLGRFTGDADSPLLRHALDALVDDQSTRGTWTSAGVLSFGRRRLVYIPSIELSLALTNLASADLHAGETDIYERAIPALAGSFQLVQSSYSRHGQKSGWRNDRTRSGYEIESWTTAVVLQFLVAYRETLALAQQETILRKYRAVRSPAGFENFWPDLNRLIPAPERYTVLSTRALKPSRLKRFTSLVDPTSENAIVDGVRREVIEPTLLNVDERPTDTVSLLLYGPPGTRKTTFVVKLAETLDWPLIVLSPPIFLGAGIEGFESQADKIFEDLFRLRRVVVLFDECEEFFRWRPPEVTVESRTVGAFITSGMLPRLQRLRDSRWIVFVINSNAEAFELDDAVTRRGRLDKAARVGHPELAAQLRYLRNWRSRNQGLKLSSQQFAWFETHLSRVEADMGPIRQTLEQERGAAQAQFPDRGPEYRDRMAKLQQQAARELTKVVTFSMLDDLAERCVGEGNQSKIGGSRSLNENLEQEFLRFGPDRFAPPKIRSSPRRKGPRKSPRSRPAARG